MAGCAEPDPTSGGAAAEPEPTAAGSAEPEPAFGSGTSGGGGSDGLAAAIAEPLPSGFFASLSLLPPENAIATMITTTASPTAPPMYTIGLRVLWGSNSSSS